MGILTAYESSARHAQCTLPPKINKQNGTILHKQAISRPIRPHLQTKLMCTDNKK